MNLREVDRELISCYVDGEVTAEERANAQRLLESSAEMRAYHDELQKLRETLNAWTPTPPSPEWARRVEQALREKTASASVSVYRKRRTWAWSLGGASCAVAAAALVLMFRPMERVLPPTSAPTQNLTQVTAAPAAQESADVLYEYERVGERVGRVVQGYALSSLGKQGWTQQEPFNTERYDRIYETRFLSPLENPLSTFSIDVDTASYANVRRFLQAGQLPPEDAVRIEEMINYFDYDYPQPEGEAPFSITLDRSACPWNQAHELVRIGLKGRVFAGQTPPSNLVFLVDVSGSMDEPNKLPLLKSAMKRMVDHLTSSERVALVVYAGAAGLVLDSTPGDQHVTIQSAINQLQAGGSTAGGEGIRLAYEIARKHFVKDGNNRVILATDGDFNVGASSTGELVRLIEEERRAGVFLTVLGFGTGNYNDEMMEQVADKGNGNYYYIDTEREARKVLEEELGSVLFVIAKDVKIQIEFNPAYVKSYRLIGYENRQLAKEDFNDDTKDAGELGAGHTVTVLYEIVQAASQEASASVDELKFQRVERVPSDDMIVVKLRYKAPDQDTSQLLVKTIRGDAGLGMGNDFRFAVAVAEFGMLLRNSEFKGASSYDHVLTEASASLGKDPYGYRAEFIELVKKAKGLDHRSTDATPGITFKGQ